MKHLKCVESILLKNWSVCCFFQGGPPPPPHPYKGGGIDPPKNRKKEVDRKFWVKRGWLARRGIVLKGVDRSQKVKFLK